MNEVLEKYKSSYLPIDIEWIISDFWLSLDYFDFSTINGFIAWKHIAVNKSLCIAEQRFVIAHELWHFLDGEIWASTELFSTTDPKEKIADQFAMDLLCPTFKVRELWEKYENIPTLSQIFLVSNEVIEKKLKQVYKSSRYSYESSNLL